ncbi:DUF1553 domain-containing protein [Armatimonas rosea]|uniref:Cytochrome c553 n=1 Tax=Armatimonas rosea TaxID=685828 RepID=A0A7W9W804_ARMRO|nr:DUF1553 domain-containing protein [Armatimonas rosea]MBB6052233.1 cytochrome c553 [Armatimonas rosea]
MKLSLLAAMVPMVGLVGLALAQSSPEIKALTPAQSQHFEARVRPVLVAKCGLCHSGQSPQAGLDLTKPLSLAKAQEALRRMQGVGGKPIMPPSGKLADSEIVGIAQWVQEGASWPQTTAKTPTVSVGKHWSFISPKRPLEPPVEKSGIDAFVLGALAKNGITPAPRADKRTLLRRVSFDLIGLPPTQEQMSAFLADSSPAAFAKQVDRLLASKQFGERWGRHWLDVARYADSNGLDENTAHAQAWRYRDWVIEALNRDLPYDEFIRQQLAGDLMLTGNDSEDAGRLTATGYLVLGPKVLAEPDKEKMVMDIVDEQIDVVTKSVIGLTVACARCHDHKFDPIATKDYYALAGIFKSTRTMETLNTVARWYERPLSSPTLKAELATYQQSLGPALQAVDEAKKQLDGALNGNGKALLADASAFNRGERLGKEQYGPKSINSNGSPTFAEWDFSVPTAGRYKVYLRYAAEESRPVVLTVAGKNLGKKIAASTTGGWQEEDQRWESAGVQQLEAGLCTVRIERNGAIPHFSRIALVPMGKTDLDLAGAEKALKTAQDTLKALEAKKPSPPMVMCVTENTKIEDVKVHIRGDTQTLGDLVPRGFPSVLCGGTRQPLEQPKSSGRKELAYWLTRPDHPLTSRVAVNRVWQKLFGEGLVGTADNWGLRGDKPSNPQLLDYLATSFVTDDGWSMKKLIRRIVLSDTYQQASRYTDPVGQKKDIENKLVWRQNRRRLDAEPLRDSLLYVAGTLDTTMGGSLLGSKDYDYVTNDQSANKAQYDAPRRAIYLPVIRNAVYDFFGTFDFGDPSMVNAKRTPTTVSPQALYLLNSPLVMAQAQAFAKSLTGDDDAKIRQAYERAFQRLPLPGELATARRFLNRAAQVVPTERAWAAWCQTLLAANEFLYVD